MDGPVPARVPDGVIDEIRSRERGGFVELPCSSCYNCLAGSSRVELARSAIEAV